MKKYYILIYKMGRGKSKQTRVQNFHSLEAAYIEIEIVKDIYKSAKDFKIYEQVEGLHD